MRLQEQRHLMPFRWSHLFQGVGKWNRGSTSALPLPLPAAQKHKGFPPLFSLCFSLYVSSFSSVLPALRSVTQLGTCRQQKHCGFELW